MNAVYPDSVCFDRRVKSGAERKTILQSEHKRGVLRGRDIRGLFTFAHDLSPYCPNVHRARALLHVRVSAFW